MTIASDGRQTEGGTGGDAVGVADADADGDDDGSDDGNDDGDDDGGDDGDDDGDGAEVAGGENGAVSVELELEEDKEPSREGALLTAAISSWDSRCTVRAERKPLPNARTRPAASAARLIVIRPRLGRARRAGVAAIPLLRVPQALDPPPGRSLEPWDWGSAGSNSKAVGTPAPARLGHLIPLEAPRGS